MHVWKECVVNIKIDITKLIRGNTNKINLSSQINIPKENFTNSLIYDLSNVTFDGELTESDELLLTGTITGTMHLKDDITLEPVEYEFKTDINEILPKFQNILDITDILWQNILVEVPSKVRSTDEEIELKGDGWRVITEEQYNKERQKASNPFANLDKLLNTKEEKWHGSSI